MIKGIDHVVILVKDLDQAVADYTQLGFNVVPGGEHTDGATHNALIAFADGSYLELIAFKREAPEHRWWKHTLNENKKGEGLIDFALLPSDIENDIAAARQRGLDYKGPLPGGRQRPDGQEIKWQTGQPTTPDLPFLCGDVTPRSLRVPSGPAWVHPNGVTGIEEITVFVENMQESVDHYAALLGVEPPVPTENDIEAAKEKKFTKFDYLRTFELGPGKISLMNFDTQSKEMTELILEGRDGHPAGIKFKAPISIAFDQDLTHHAGFGMDKKFYGYGNEPWGWKKLENN